MNEVDKMFIKIALHNKLIIKPQVDMILDEKEDDDHDVGEVMVEMGIISEKQFSAIDKARRKHLEKKGISMPTKKKKKSGGGGGGGGNSGTGAIKDIELPPALKKIEQKDMSQLYGKGIANYLKFARNVGASDLHMDSFARPFLRVSGQIVYLNHPILEPEVNEKMLLEILNERDKRVYQETQDLDFSYEAEGLGRFRCNYCHQRRGINGVFRLIPLEVPTLEDLGMPPILKKFTTYHLGLVLITGPAGCGKSSTLASLVELVNGSRHDHVITVEDPIEFLFESKGCNITQRQVEVHTKAWGTAIRAALREDPDVIIIGEMRDLDTISTAITAAETGHLVMGTLNTNNATRTVDRILDVFPPKEQAQIRTMVSESLKGVVSQQLIPRVDGKGRVPAVEILFNTAAVGNLIREGRTFQLYSVMQTGKKLGMVLMDDSIRKLLDQGIISHEDAVFFASDPKRFK